ncbi:MAG TPA: polyphenol oxidase family protein, partial [Thermoanaerobaculia bacterium]
MTDFVVEQSPFGRIVVAPSLPEGRALFYTTIDFHGQLDAKIARDITAFIAERFQIDATLATCMQIHSANVTRVAHAPRWSECDRCDALWSSDRGVALGIKVADCLPVTIFDDHDILANIHSGWRGAVQNITAATLDAAPIDPARASAYLGPTIRVCCFEVGEEVAQ